MLDRIEVGDVLSMRTGTDPPKWWTGTMTDWLGRSAKLRGRRGGTGILRWNDGDPKLVLSDGRVITRVSALVVRDPDGQIKAEWTSAQVDNPAVHRTAARLARGG